MNEGEKPLTAENIELRKGNYQNRSRIRDILRHHEILKKDWLRDIIVDERAINLKEGSNPFQSASCRFGPSTCQSEPI